MIITVRDSVYCPFCGSLIDVETTFCEHVSYVYLWSSVDLDGYVYINPNFFQHLLPSKMSTAAYRRLFSKLSPQEMHAFLDNAFEPLSEIATMVTYCGNKADITFSVSSYCSGYYVGVSANTK